MILQGGGERTFAAYVLFVRMGPLIRGRSSIQTHVHLRVFEEILEERVVSSRGQATGRQAEDERLRPPQDGPMSRRQHDWTPEIIQN